MSDAVRQALEVLETIQMYFREGSESIFRDGLLFEHDATLGEAVDAAVKALKEETK